jgi:hypothetical protein
LTTDKRLGGINPALCNPVRPDFFWDFGTWVLVVENDEHQHVLNEARCELLRLQDIVNAFAETPTYVIRYNPHAFKVCGWTRVTGTTERMELLFETIQGVIATPPVDHHITIQYLFYNCTRCEPGKCPFSHTDRFKTMVDYATYIDANYPLSLMGTGQHAGPSASAE